MKIADMFLQLEEAYWSADSSIVNGWAFGLTNRRDNFNHHSTWLLDHQIALNLAHAMKKMLITKGNARVYHALHAPPDRIQH